MKNITKLKFIATVLSASVLILTLAGCNDLTGSKAQEKNQQTVEKSYTVSGKILFDGKTGAAPKELVNALTAKADSSDRAATTSFTLQGGYTYVAKAEKFVKEDAQNGITWDVNNPVMGNVIIGNNGISYSIKLTKTGMWNIVFSIVEAEHPENTLAKFEKIINLNSNYELLDQDDNPLSNVDFELKPSYSDIKTEEPYYETSSVRLTVSKDQFEEASDNDIVKVVWRWQNINYVANTFPTDATTWKEAVEAWMFSQTPVEKVFENGETSVVFEFTDVPACSFNICLTFVTADGRNLYVYQDINVFKNFVTDTWYGQDNYFELDENNKYNLVIKPEHLKNAGENYLLYNYVYDSVSNTSKFKYFTITDLALVNDDVYYIPTPTNQPTVDFCFDSAGFVYFLNAFNDNEVGSWNIMSNSGGSLGYFQDKPIPTYIAYDQVTNLLYVLAYNETDNKITLLEVNNSQDASSFTKYELISEVSGHILKDFVVNNNIAYFAFEKDTEGTHEVISTYKTDIALAKMDLSEYDPVENPDNSYVSSFVTKQYDHQVTITDMLYQDEKLYVLINHDHPTANNIIYSTGEILRYDIKAETYVSTYGFAQSTINTIKTGIISSLANGNIFYSSYGAANDLSSGIPVVHEFQNVSIQLYAPYSNSGSIDTTHFAGPQKFVAIKPKKLVITDAGIALYKDDDGVTKYKEVNRVVYVNIEDLSFSGSVDVDLQLLESYNQPNLSIQDTLGNSISRYIWNSGSGTFNQMTPPETIYAHIIKED